MTEQKSNIDNLLTDKERKYFAWLRSRSLTPRYGFSFFLSIAASSLFLDWIALQSQAYWLTMVAELITLMWVAFFIFVLVYALTTIRGILEKYEAFLTELANRQNDGRVFLPVSWTRRLPGWIGRSHQGCEKIKRRGHLIN